MRAFAISDIHGCSATFRALIKKINLKKSDRLYLLGDYIDRGPDSKGVVQYILKLMDKGYNVSCLKGNHEDCFYSKPGSNEWLSWLRQGGQQTLDSFKVNSYSSLKKKYISFFDNLKFYVIYNDFLLVHAGFNFSISDPFSDKHAMLWVRNMKYNSKKVGKKRIVHGHTPQKLKTVLLSYSKNDKIINIDTGCVYKNREGMGYLCAFELNTNSFYIQQNIDEY